MLESQKKRLLIRIETCENEIALANRRIASDANDLKFWKNEKACAQAELTGMQLELNLRCSNCGD